MDYIVEQKEKGNMHPFGDDVFKASTFLAKVIWDSIGEIVHAATDAMAWFRKHHGLPVARACQSGDTL